MADDLPNGSSRLLNHNPAGQTAGLSVSAYYKQPTVSQLPE